MKQVMTQGAQGLNDHARPNKPQRSRFDISRITNLTADAGMIIPIDVFPVLPGDDLDIDTEMILDTLPLSAPSLTKYKATVHWYYMKARDTWKGFKTFWTRGRSGNVEKTVPRIKVNHKSGATTMKYAGVTENTDIYPSGFHSLTAYLTGQPGGNSGVPADANTLIKKEYLPYTAVSKGGHATEWDNLTKTGHNGLESGDDEINAMPFVMYQSIVKNNYVNENLLQGNTALFPEEGDDDWLLPYNASTVNYIGRNEANNTGEDITSADWRFDYTGIFHNDDTRVRLDLLRYAMFDDDYFTQGLPWLQRGEVPQLEADITGISVGTTIEATKNVLSAGARWLTESQNWDDESIARYPVAINKTTGDTEIQDYLINGNKTNLFTNNDPHVLRTLTLGTKLAEALKATSTVTGNGQVQITTNALREMIAMQVWQERNARVDGSYNAMTFQHWLINPESEEHRPIYIGGSADYISFTNVIQNSESTAQSPLGTTAGFGSLAGKASVGHLKAKDYGYVMGILIIKPNTTYEQGFEHFWRHERVFEEMIQPEFQGLSPEPIYNDEIYVSGDRDEDRGLFCYQERYSYLKQRLNCNRGLFTASEENDKLFTAYTQARWFNSKPTFSYQFLVMSPENMRRDFLAYPYYPMFRIQFATKAYVTRELAYMSEPNTFGF